MSTVRQNKVSALLQKELGTFFQRESLTYFGGSMISVTVVRVAPDFSLAKVYLSIFSPPGTLSREEVFKFVLSQTKEIRFKLGQEIGKQMRIVPELAFYLDDSINYAQEIDRLLKK
jgi:ribosome-binding factor A